jgi:hypothetical protein
MREPTDQDWRALREPFDHPQKVKKEWTDKKTGERKSITLDYIGHAVVTDRLLAVDPEFSFWPLRDEKGIPIVVLDGLAPGDKVGVWGKLHLLGVDVVEFCSGKDLMDAYSRCLCRCAMRRGVALDLWIKDDEFKAQPEVRKEGGLGNMPVPRSWTKVREWYDQHGSWELAELFTRACSYHLYGKIDSKDLTPEQRKVMLQKASGAVVWLAENPNTPIGPTPSVEHYRKAWAHVLDGVMLEVPEWQPRSMDESATPDEEAERLADEAIVGPPA